MFYFVFSMFLFCNVASCLNASEEELTGIKQQDGFTFFGPDRLEEEAIHMDAPGEESRRMQEEADFMLAVKLQRECDEEYNQRCTAAEQERNDLMLAQMLQEKEYKKYTEAVEEERKRQKRVNLMLANMATAEIEERQKRVGPVSIEEITEREKQEHAKFMLAKKERENERRRRVDFVLVDELSEGNKQEHDDFEFDKKERQKRAGSVSDDELTEKEKQEYVKFMAANAAKKKQKQDHIDFVFPEEVIGIEEQYAAVPDRGAACAAKEKQEQGHVVDSTPDEKAFILPAPEELASAIRDQHIENVFLQEIESLEQVDLDEEKKRQQSEANLMRIKVLLLDIKMILESLK